MGAVGNGGSWECGWLEMRLPTGSSHCTEVALSIALQPWLLLTDKIMFREQIVKGFERHMDTIPHCSGTRT